MRVSDSRGGMWYGWDIASGSIVEKMESDLSLVAECVVPGTRQKEEGQPLLVVSRPHLRPEAGSASDAFATAVDAGMPGYIGLRQGTKPNKRARFLC